MTAAEREYAARSVADCIREIPFAVKAIVETLLEPGSYKRELATRAAESIKRDVEEALGLLEKQKNGGK